MQIFDTHNLNGRIAEKNKKKARLLAGSMVLCLVSWFLDKPEIERAIDLDQHPELIHA